MIDIGKDLQRAYSDGYKCGRLEALDELLKYIGEMGNYEADRKTENSSEKPNNCEDLQDWKDRMWAEAIVTEPTISKMEQVDEPQTCDTCKYGEDKHRYAHICNECGVGINNYEPKDEPQTCEECEHWNDSEDGCADRHGCKTEPQTERSSE